ncbi:MAG: hypothetical protein Ct9H300mP11_09440 [Chloroflexota bacterium]|nr:MAG: hypothetical protein Ct9H300mP11_09440 [Chloroflexota bacterium]
MGACSFSMLWGGLFDLNPNRSRCRSADYLNEAYCIWRRLVDLSERGSSQLELS